MRILVASDAFPPKIDGVADTSARICSMLAASGHNVVAVAPAPGFEEQDGYRVRRLKGIPFPLYPEVKVIVEPRRIARIVKHFKPDAAVILTPGPVGVLTARALSVDVPLVHIYTTDIPNYMREYRLGFATGPVDSMLRWLSDRSTATLCPTAAVRDALAGRGHSRLEVWGRGVDETLYGPLARTEEMRHRLTDGNPGQPVALYIGRLAKEKRLDTFAAAARQLPGVRFAIVGDGPYRSSLEKSFADLPAVFTGYLRGQELASAYASADLFVFPSDTDTFGQVVLQAMASGLPPVVVAGSPTAEFVEHGIAGLHVAAQDPRALASAIRTLTEDDDHRTALGIAARERSLGFSWHTLVGRLEDLLVGCATVDPAA